MPLYRQEAMFHAAGISVTRGTLSNWLIQTAHLLTPLVKLLIADILAHDVAYADETTLQVIKNLFSLRFSLYINKNKVDLDK